MRVLLIRTKTQKHIFGAESFLPLGIAYVAAVLKKAGHEVKVLDLTVENLKDEEVVESAVKFGADLAGFSTVTPTINSTYKIAGMLKKNSNIKTATGGPHVSALPDEALKNNIDFVIRGEGEESILDLVSNIDAPYKVKGISYVDESGNIIHNPDREYIKNLDDLPFPARELFPDQNLYKGQPALGNRVPVANIVTSRGCPHSCNFCSRAIFGQKFRARSPHNVIEEWKYLVKVKKVKEIAITEDNFTLDSKRVHTFCDMVINEKLKIPWCCPQGIHVSTPFEILKKMKESGCYRVALGVESGCQEILNRISKRITLEQIEKAVDNCRKLKIETMGFFMLGNLGENESTMQTTIDFAKKIEPDYVQFTIAIPYPGTGLYEEVVKNGKILVSNWDDYGEYEGKAIFEHGELTSELMNKMHKKAYKEYYLRPQYMIRQIFNINNYLFFFRRLKATFKFLK